MPTIHVISFQSPIPTLGYVLRIVQSLVDKRIMNILLYPHNLGVLLKLSKHLFS
jgi:hypothetical protein